MPVQDRPPAPPQEYLLGQEFALNLRDFRSVAIFWLIMALSTAARDNQTKLKTALQAEANARKLEVLAAHLVGRVLGVPVSVANAGSQQGGDAGTAGRHDRHVRLECKKYADETTLNERDLLGEIDQALAWDEGLEAWILLATRSVPEQLVQVLIRKGENIGVPVLIFDWSDHNLAPLAALCAVDPDVVEAEFSPEAGALARALQMDAGDAIESLRRDLQSWCLGFDSLRKQSHLLLERIWNSRRTSGAQLNQDAAGGEKSNRIRRQSVHAALEAWRLGLAAGDAPAAIIGLDGVGKTWAAIDWLVDSAKEQPIVLAVPSSSIGNVSGLSEGPLKRMFAERLCEMTGVRSSDHWFRRLNSLLKRPKEEGPVLTVYFDGLNQEPSAPWIPLLRILQSETFEGRVRVMLSTRKYHFEEKLSHLRNLVVRPVQIAVDAYDTAAGGELDQMLAFEGLTRADLHPDLIEFARNPRLFKLVIKFREKLVEAGQVTVHRLLWEYGRDTFGDRAGKSFSDADWRAWLAEIAKGYRNGVQEYSLKTLSETASRPDLSGNEVYARLSDIIDGRFAMAGTPGTLHLNPTVVAHSLGAALLSHLETMQARPFAEVEAEAAEWLDPIAGLDQRAEILRAAVSILVERGSSASNSIPGVLVTAWLQTQNITDNHRSELAMLAPFIPDALLDALEHSGAPAQASATLWAVNALRAIPKTESAAFRAIVTRARAWLSVVSRDVIEERKSNPDFEKRRAERYEKRIGTDASGPKTVLGVELCLVDRDDGRLQALVPVIVEGFPLAELRPCLEIVAIASAVRGHAEWSGLKWLFYLNELDPQPAIEAVRALSEDIRSRTPEPGIHPHLPARAAALVLWLTGHEEDEERAGSIDPDIDRVHSYEKDYLEKPSRSLFALERRHAALVLSDKGLALWARLQRTRELWLDPTFQPAAEFMDELRVAAASLDMEKIGRQVGRTQEDLQFEELELPLARCAPEALADLVRRKLQSHANAPPDQRHWIAHRALGDFLLAGPTEAQAAERLRLSATEKDDNREGMVASYFLRIELLALGDARSQFQKLINASPKFIPANFDAILHAPSTEDADALIGEYRDASPKHLYDLIVLLSVHPIAFSDSAWSWLTGLADQREHELRHVLFRMLYRADAMRFGRHLADKAWSWEPAAHIWVNHYGTGALIKVGSGLSFDQIAPRLAPWRLLETARRRGADPAEVRIAAEILGYALAAERLEEPDPGSDIKMERSEREFTRFSYSVTPRPNLAEQANPLANLDPEASANAHIRAFDTATARIDDARRAGASLYLTELQAADMLPVLKHAPDLWPRWIEGYRELTTDFRRRVRLAEMAFLALCEALLTSCPEQGIELWRALRVTLQTRFVTDAGIDELLDMAFRAPDSAPLAELRGEILSLTMCHTDQMLFHVAVAASCHGKGEWLARTAEADKDASLVWQQRRGLVLGGFTTGNTLPVPEAWPEGQLRTGVAQLRRNAARYRWREACARHWWGKYLSAPDAPSAYAAWKLFLHSADRRAFAWMDEDTGLNSQAKSSFFDRKLSHVQLNFSELKSEMGKRLERADREFLSHDVTEGIGPWRNAA